MARYDGKTLAIIKRLQNARLSLMAKQPFYALLLMNMKFSLDVTCETAYTDGDRVAFNPDFIEEIDDGELEFVLMHEVLHAALAHPFRHQSDYQQKEFDYACDIIVNSNILYSFGMDKRKITLKKYGEAMHLLPNGEEGYKYSVEEAYKMLLAVTSKPNKQNSKGKKSKEKNQAQGGFNAQSAGSEADNGEGSGGKGGSETGKGSSCPSLEDLIASIKKKNDSIRENLEKNRSEETSDDSNGDGNGNGDGAESFDDHSFWEGDDDMGSQRDAWMNRMVEATDMIASMANGGKSRGTIPAGVERIINEIKNPILDWRTILNDFVQEDICDYSFAPPDKRMEDPPFFLPDFNEKDESAKNLLFMIDTSGSMSKEEITDCYSEIYGAIQQFNGKLTGKLGFFDAVVVEPVPFEDEDEFKIIRPKGGGGTSFHIIFDYVKKKMMDEPPVSIIILTDGYAPYPDEAAAMDIPVLWIINNKEAEAPSWGKVARMIAEEKN